jgi:ribonuclease T2
MRLTPFAALFLALFTLTPSARADSGPPPNLVATEDFDFYVLTLSWSPGFCDTGGAAKSKDQCSVGAGEGFVVHGLWPDNANKADPADCGSPAAIPNDVLQQTLGVYPAPGLARYEYGKHGTCTGLSPENYFAAVKYARNQIAIPDFLQAPHEKLMKSPDEIASAFIAANANLTADNMAITCSHGELVDMRFCLSKDLKAFSNCRKVSGHTCNSRSIAVAPLR